jgi:hypothetical protein
LNRSCQDLREKEEGFPKKRDSKQVDGCGTTAVQVKRVEKRLTIPVVQKSLVSAQWHGTVLNAGTIEALEQVLILH